MFKKKLNIPPRPKPPTLEQLQEDLKCASHNDVVVLLKQRVESSQTNSDHSKDGSDPDTVFHKVKSFIEANRDLQDIVHVLQEEVQNLQSTDEELKNMAEEIRKQAVDARKIAELA